MASNCTFIWIDDECWDEINSGVNQSQYKDYLLSFMRYSGSLNKNVASDLDFNVKKAKPLKVTKISPNKYILLHWLLPSLTVLVFSRQEEIKQKILPYYKSKYDKLMKTLKNTDHLLECLSPDYLMKYTDDPFTKVEYHKYIRHILEWKPELTQIKMHDNYDMKQMFSTRVKFTYQTINSEKDVADWETFYEMEDDFMCSLYLNHVDAVINENYRLFRYVVCHSDLSQLMKRTYQCCILKRNVILSIKQYHIQSASDVYAIDWDKECKPSQRPIYDDRLIEMIKQKMKFGYDDEIQRKKETSRQQKEENPIPDTYWNDSEDIEFDLFD